MSLTDTPRANRLHIGIFGKRNSGKSSLINALTGQETALVSDVPGTTTDPVYKSMELHGVGPCVLIDTAGFDDCGELGNMRVAKTKQAMEKTDIALVLFSGEEFAAESRWIQSLRKQKTPIIAIVNKADIRPDAAAAAKTIAAQYKLKPLLVSAKTHENLAQIREEIIASIPEDYDARSITGRLTKKGDLVLLVMPQDIQAPKGRLILPQVQTIRELLDKQCAVMSCGADRMTAALNHLSKPPDLIIVDSQAFAAAAAHKPKESKLTSFSILFANYKGDLDYFMESAAKLERLTENSHVLIAEACTHAPLSEDIGREKIPRLLRKKFGAALNVTVVGGADFPEDLSPYDFIIHCGACMFNRKHVLMRTERARAQNVPMSNYGVVLAYFAGILEQVDLP